MKLFQSSSESDVNAFLVWTRMFFDVPNTEEVGGVRKDASNCVHQCELTVGNENKLRLRVHFDSEQNLFQGVGEGRLKRAGKRKLQMHEDVHLVRFVHCPLVIFFGLVA